VDIKIGWGGVDWIYLVQGRDQLEASCEHGLNLRVRYNAEKFLGRCTAGDLFTRAQLLIVSSVHSLLGRKKDMNKRGDASCM
jgi:hypothetical protein